ncbi:acyl carrier protein [Azotobacter beijerinckii]|uniref:Acyl carrier protein AcpXL n=1 Tax=Azotobacter beijerinckii TaxID=170623 RepID=A0A1I4DGS3_9GAMM|nr:acyl carrier protein [Azotobacter beijerinckii]SFB34793.1 acyl carrier protein [Azotobacter beijerinckii]SFK91687.1 acyl carrier protein [Azotobacter beijerinckii]
MISQEKILERLFFHLDRLAFPGESIHPSVDLIEELGLDSINAMDLVMELEDEFDISIPLNVLTDVHTPTQLAQAVLSMMEHADGVA